ncbi:hypothetical protein AAHC03_09497 [Spirometra sp. Aus1]
MLFNIIIFKQFSGQLVQSRNVSSSLNETQFDGLSPFTNYTVLLRTLDILGPGNGSLEYTICTEPGRPTIKPEVSLINVTNTTATLHLLAPNLTQAVGEDFCPDAYLSTDGVIGPFRGFRLLYRSDQRERELSPTSSDRPLHQETYHLTDLLPYTEYWVTAAIFNGRFFGPPSNLTFRTLEGIPGPPPKVWIEGKTATSLTAEWHSPGNLQGPITGYKFKLSECDDSSPIILSTSNVTHFVATDLQHSTCYWIQVASETVAGMSNFSSYIIAYTHCLPLPVPQLTNITLVPDGFQLVWLQETPEAVSADRLRFAVCIQSTALDTPSCHIVQSKSLPEGNRYLGVLPLHVINNYNAEEILFSVRSACRPQKCPDGLDCATKSDLSNAFKLNLQALLQSPPKNSRMDLDDNAIGGIIGAVFVLLMICCVGPFSFLYWRSSCNYKGYEVARLNGDAGDQRTPLVLTMTRFEDSPHEPIPAAELPQRVALYHADEDAGYQAEFEAIEQNVRTNWPTAIARLPENMQKNRYSNVFAYDHTRVVLKNPHGRKSDYINANYVDGFRRPKAYIAAQGPMSSTFDDFWQMIWDENCSIIVMISNFVERGKRKCDQYWPSEGQQSYGTISVRMLSETVLACYVIRVFDVKNLKCKKFAKDRIVYHYQYTDWRDFDVPLSPLPVLVFVKTTVAHWSSVTGPITVHCSAGVGRTGTYICIESLIRQLETENQVNIQGFLEHIRQQRMKLVQTEQQYAFIHDALREYLVRPEHEVLASDFAAYVRCLRKVEPCGCSGLQKQFEICTEKVPRDYEFTEARKACNLPKNRSDIVPTDARRVTLPSEPGVDGSSYINASVVQGYRSLSEFIIAQQPLESTEADFWKMVWEKNSPFIFVLSSEDMPCFWPESPQSGRVIGWLRVGFCSSEAVSENLTHFEFHLSSSHEDYALTCHLWRVHKWPTTVTAESTRDLLKLQFFLVSNHTSVAGGPAVVVDDFGGNRAGIFCAVNFLINQFTLAGVIDVYFIVKMLHLQRAKIFRSYEDLDYIYMVIEQFLADLQQDETTEAYAAGYANLGVGIFNGTSPSVNPFVLNKSVHTNRSANSSERALQCSGGGGASAGDFVSTPPPATDRDNLLTAGDCHPDLAALQKLPDSQSATAVFTTPTPQTPSDHHNGNRTGGPTVPITSASTPATPCPQDDDDHVFELRSLAPSCSLSHSLATTEYAKTNGTVAFLNDHRIPSYHPSGHINCKSGGSVRKNAAYLATLLPPPPNQSPPPPPSLSWASDVSSPPSPHSNAVPEGVMQPDSGDLTPTTSIVCAGSHLDDGELTMTI